MGCGSSLGTPEKVRVTGAVLLDLIQDSPGLDSARELGVAMLIERESA